MTGLKNIPGATVLIVLVLSLVISLVSGLVITIRDCGIFGSLTPCGDLGSMGSPIPFATYTLPSYHYGANPLLDDYFGGTLGDSEIPLLKGLPYQYASFSLFYFLMNWFLIFLIIFFIKNKLKLFIVSSFIAAAINIETLNQTFYVNNITGFLTYLSDFLLIRVILVMIILKFIIKFGRKLLNR